LAHHSFPTRRSSDLDVAWWYGVAFLHHAVVGVAEIGQSRTRVRAGVGIARWSGGRVDRANGSLEDVAGNISLARIDCDGLRRIVFARIEVILQERFDRVGRPDISPA